MFARVVTAAQLKNFLERRIVEKEKILTEMDKARSDGDLRNFMNWNGSALHVAVVHADQSKCLMDFLAEKTERDGEILSDEVKFEIAKEEVQRNLSNMNTRLVSRSTNVSANLDEDAQRMFWIDVYKALNGGY